MRRKSLISLPRWLKRREPQPAATPAAAAIDESLDAAVAARDEAVAKLQARTAFLSSISHELRTPITAMIGMAELLAETSLDDQQRRYLEILTGNGNTLLNLVNDILDFTRAESGHLVLDAAEFDLAELVESVAETLAPQAHRKGLELSARIAEDVSATVVGDSRRLRQILMNLAGNAIKFTSAGEVAIIAEREPETPGMMRFTVIDTGPGIDPADHARIFTSYAQAAERGVASAGSGLGLAIVKQMAELMGGRVRLESTTGRGSSFHCSVRMGYQPRTNLGYEHQPGQVLAGRHIILISTAAHCRRALTAALVAEGVNVMPVSEPADAVSAAGQMPGRLDAVLADWPANSSGFHAVLSSLRAALPAQIPVIALLPATDRAARLDSLSAIGVNRYVTKPPRRAELIAEVSAAMEAGPERDRGGAPTVKQPEAETLSALTGLRILLADDAEDNRVLIEAYLRHSGCQLDLASSGSEAVRLFIGQPYDVILMDLHMPEMDGYEAIRQIRAWERTQERKHTPIIALSAAVLEASVQESLEAGCDSHVSKPVKRSALFSALREVIAVSAEVRR